MLKIYNAYVNHGRFELDDHIIFDCGKFYTGYNGFGEVHSGDPKCIKANYELQSLKEFEDYSSNVKVDDGWAQSFTILHPMSYEKIAEKYGNVVKTPEDYEKYGLNEEGILLFTDYIHLRYVNDGLVKKIFGRDQNAGLYLLMPNASVSMEVASSTSKDEKKYEVLQSQSLGKQLILAQMNRKI